MYATSLHVLLVYNIQSLKFKVKNNCFQPVLVDSIQQGSAQNDLSGGLPVVKMVLYCIEYCILVLLFSLSGGKNRPF